MNKRFYLLLLTLVILLAGFFTLALPAFSQVSPQVKPTTWPTDVPLYAGAKPLTGLTPNPSEVQYEWGLAKLYFLESDASPEATVSWYKGNLPKNGWTAVSKEDYVKTFRWVEEYSLQIPGGVPKTPSGEILEVYSKTYLAFFKSKADGCYGLTVFAHTLVNKNFIILSELRSSDLPCPAGEELAPPKTPEEKPEVIEECVLSPDVEAERQEVIKRVKENYGLEIVDSNLCGKETCGNNSPWSIDELSEMERVLGGLPSCFTDRLRLSQIGGRTGGKLIFSGLHEKFCCKVEKGKPLEQGKGFGAYIYLESKVTICDKNYVGSQYTLEYLLAHELTHAFQWFDMTVPSYCYKWPCPGGAYTNPIMIDWLKETGWSPDGVCTPTLGCPGVDITPPPDLPTEYARKSKNPLEDMAESVALYVTNPDTLIEISPRRYNFVKDKIMCGKEFHE